MKATHTTDAVVERGATATEYALLVSAIAAVIVLVVYAFGDNVLDLFFDTCQTMTSKAGGDCA
jgi:Flp pilus assembly pilin Flp